MKKNVNVLMELDLKKALDKDAKKNHRSVGKHINFKIEKHLNTILCDTCDDGEDCLCIWDDIHKEKGVANEI